nr:hypothetical protein [Tanacetum cinerariifolium]
KSPAVVPIIPFSQMELSGMALGPQVQLLELDRSGIFTGRAGDRPGKFSKNTLGKSWMIGHEKIVSRDFSPDVTFCSTED